MKNGVSFKHIVRVLGSEYIKLLTNGKLILLLVLAVMIREIIIRPILEAAEYMGQPINILEPCISAANSGVVMLLIPLVYLVLISDFPSIDGNTYYLIPRIGRKNWILGEVLFQIVSLVSYILFIILSIMVQAAGSSFLVNGWSLVATDYAAARAEEGAEVSLSEIIPLNLYYQMPPVKAFAMSYLLIFLFIFICGLTMLWVSLYGKKIIGFWFILCTIALGIVLCSANVKWMWLFPISHSILWIHYQPYYRKYVFSPRLSLVLLVFLVVLFLSLIMKKSKDVNLDTLREEHEG